MYETNCWFQAKVKNLIETIRSGSQTVSHPLKEIWPHQGWCWEEFSTVLVTSCLFPRGVGCNMSFIAVDGVFYSQSGPLVWVGGLLLAQPCVGGLAGLHLKQTSVGLWAVQRLPVLWTWTQHVFTRLLNMHFTTSVRFKMVFLFFLMYVATIVEKAQCGVCVCVFSHSTKLSVKYHVKRLCVAPLNYQCK